MKETHYIFKTSKCSSCGLCVDLCKHNALTVDIDSNGFYFIHYIKQKCNNCGICMRYCPEKKIMENQRISSFLSGYTLNNEYLKQSASGGIFMQIASDFLKAGNSIVFGASLDKSFVKHIPITNERDLIKISNSKYAHSKTVGIFKEIEVFLKEGKRILFSGTPCQVAAVKSKFNDYYLNNKLFLVDIICHGIPSFFLEKNSLEFHSAIKIIGYRNKSQGWRKSQRMTYMKSDGQLLEISKRENDLFYRSFLSDSFLRPNCYDCKYASINRNSDISLADYWGNKKNNNETFNGISLIMINNTDKANHILLKQNYKLHSLTKDETRAALMRNPNIIMNNHILKYTQLSHFLWLISKMPKQIRHKVFMLKCKNNPVGILVYIYLLIQRLFLFLETKRRIKIISKFLYEK